MKPCDRSHNDLGLTEPCPDCGHASAVHGGIGAPRTKYCLACQIDILQGSEPGEDPQTV